VGAGGLLVSSVAGNGSMFPTQILQSVSKFRGQGDDNDYARR